MFKNKSILLFRLTSILMKYIYLCVCINAKVLLVAKIILFLKLKINCYIILPFFNKIAGQNFKEMVHIVCI